MALRRINKELKDIISDPPDIFELGPIGNDLFIWKVILFGPNDTPYEGWRY